MSTSTLQQAVLTWPALILENFLPEGNPQDTDNPQEHEGAGGSSNMDLQEQFEQQLESDADGE